MAFVHAIATELLSDVRFAKYSCYAQSFAQPFPLVTLVSQRCSRR
jgi:hypothetical protein